jgi:hypothetical protein
MQVIGAKCYELRAWMFLGDIRLLSGARLFRENSSKN